MACTNRASVGPKWCLCQSNGCTLNPASPPWEGMRCHPPSRPRFSTVAHICSQSQTRQLCCNQVYKKLLVAPCGSRRLWCWGWIYVTMSWWIPAPATKPCEKPPWLQILSMWDAAFCLQQAPGPLLAALPYKALMLGSGTCMVRQRLGKGQRWAFQGGVLPAARAGWHRLGC